MAERLEGLLDEPRPGRAASIGVEQVEVIVVATLEETPKNATHWSRASMAKRSGLSTTTMGRIWQAFELMAHRVDSFTLSHDPLFVERLGRRMESRPQAVHLDQTAEQILESIGRPLTRISGAAH